METLTIVYDNRATEGFKGDWGFSAFIELEEGNILFDTGAKAEILEHNLKKAGIEPREIERVFISHNHWDHAGGLPLIIEKSNNFELFIPESDCYEYERELPEKTTCVPVSAPTYIMERALSTGLMPTGMERPQYEQALIVFTEIGPILITGCSHPGIVEIAKKAVYLTGETLSLTVGGFHLYKAPREEIVKTAEELSKLTKFVAPCHCTGELGIEVFAEVFGDNFIEAKAGTEIPLEEE